MGAIEIKDGKVRIKSKGIGVWRYVTYGIITAVAFLLGIAIGIWTLEDRIVNRVLDKLKDPEVLEGIAALVRPSLVFDHNGTILSNSGAAPFISDIDVEMSEGEPSKITISPTEHLNVAPILECLNYNCYVVTKRKGKSDWIYELSSPSYFVSEDSHITKGWHFRLEIIR